MSGKQAKPKEMVNTSWSINLAQIRRLFKKRNSDIRETLERLGASK